MATMKSAWCGLLAGAMLIPAGAALANGPVFKHHDEGDQDSDEHYSDTGSHPTKAQRLGIAVESRALIDKDGVTDFELTTGKLDSTATAPGNVDKLEVELVVPEGTPERGQKEFEKEYNRLKAGGYFHDRYTGLSRNQTLSVEAEVSGFGHGKERTKIELQDVIKYRPDLVVQKLDYPTSAVVNTVVTFSATVGEHKGDTGAHADCALFVDGAQVDQADHIWVDAKGVVSCSFAYQFANPGKHNVTVKTQRVLPGLYDSSNSKGMSGQITVTNPSASLTYTATAFEQTSVSTSIYDDYYSATSTTPDRELVNSFTTSMQGRFFSGQINAAINLPLKKVSYADASDGVALNSQSYANLSPSFTGASGNPAYPTLSILSGADAASGGQIQLFRYTNDTTGAGLTLVSVFYSAGDVTYVSKQYCQSTAFNCVSGSYSTNTPFSSTPRVKLGSTYTADLVLDDGTSYSAHPSLSLSPRTIAGGAPANCYPQNFGMGSMGKSCSLFSYSSSIRDGYDVRQQ